MNFTDLADYATVAVNRSEICDGGVSSDGKNAKMSFVEIPIFTGVEVRSWIDWMDKKLAQTNFSESGKLKVAKVLIKDEAEAYIHDIESFFPFWSWKELREALLLKFGDKYDPERNTLLAEQTRQIELLYDGAFWNPPIKSSTQESKFSKHQKEESFDVQMKQLGDLDRKRKTHESVPLDLETMVKSEPIKIESKTVVGGNDVESRRDRELNLHADLLWVQEWNNQTNLKTEMFQLEERMLVPNSIQEVPVSHLEPSLRFCNTSVIFTDESETSPADTCVEMDYILAVTCVQQSKHNALQLFDRMSWAENSGNSRRKKRFPKTWCFKFKHRIMSRKKKVIKERTRNLVYKLVHEKKAVARLCWLEPESKKFPSTENFQHGKAPKIVQQTELSCEKKSSTTLEKNDLIEATESHIHDCVLQLKQVENTKCEELQMASSNCSRGSLVSSSGFVFDELPYGGDGGSMSEEKEYINSKKMQRKYFKSRRVKFKHVQRLAATLIKSEHNQVAQQRTCCKSECCQYKTENILLKRNLISSMGFTEIEEKIELYQIGTRILQYGCTHHVFLTVSHQKRQLRTRKKKQKWSKSWRFKFKSKPEVHKLKDGISVRRKQGVGTLSEVIILGLDDSDQRHNEWVLALFYWNIPETNAGTSYINDGPYVASMCSGVLQNKETVYVLDHKMELACETESVATMAMTDSITAHKQHRDELIHTKEMLAETALNISLELQEVSLAQSDECVSVLMKTCCLDNLDSSEATSLKPSSFLSEIEVCELYQDCVLQVFVGGSYRHGQCSHKKTKIKCCKTWKFTFKKKSWNHKLQTCSLKRLILMQEYGLRRNTWFPRQEQMTFSVSDMIRIRLSCLLDMIIRMVESNAGLDIDMQVVNEQIILSQAIFNGCQMAKDLLLQNRNVCDSTIAYKLFSLRKYVSQHGRSSLQQCCHAYFAVWHCWKKRHCSRLLTLSGSGIN